MVKTIQKKLLIAFIILGIIAAGTGILVHVIQKVNNEDSISMERSKEKAIVVGVKRAKYECSKLGKSESICNSITGAADQSEYRGKACWIVQVSSASPYDYSAGVIIGTEQDNFEVKLYQPSTVKPL